MANLFDRAGMSSSTSGTGTITLGSALGLVSPNLSPFLTFAAAGATDQCVVGYLILDANNNFETGWGVYSASGPTLTRNVTKSSNANALISLSGNEQVFISARAEDIATVEALADAGMQLNGSMEISQESGTNVVTLSNGTNKYVVDGTLMGLSSSSLVLTGQQVAPPGSPPFGPAFPWCVQMKATTGAALGAGDACIISHRIEGYRLTKCGFGAAGASPITIGFWFYATISGTLGLSLRNGGASRSYVVDVTINNSATWQWIVVTIPGDVAGSWPGATNIDPVLQFACSGSNSQTTPNSWQTGLFLGTSSSTNFMATTNNVMCITGLVILPGAHVISQEASPLIMRSLPDELPRCQRYFRKSYAQGVAVGSMVSSGGGGAHDTPPVVGNNIENYIQFAPPMRTTPTMTFYDNAGTAGKVSYFTGSWNNGGAIAGSAAINDQAAYVTLAISGANSYSYDYVADARL